MSNKKKLIDFFQSEGLLFPETEEEVEKFEQLYPDYNEKPADWDAPEEIIKRGFQKLNHIEPKQDDTIESDILDLKMVARKGNKLSKSILDKMKKNQEKNDK